MTTDIEIRAYRLFVEALDAPADAREGLFSCAEPRVAGLARNMLRGYEQTQRGTSERRAVSGLWSRDLTGSTIDGWRIHQQIGYGGYGRVFRVSRAVGAERLEAAVKFLGVSQAGAARFLRERQMLASLHHPGICRFLDGGTTEDGFPYLVMEYVPGLPITSYCQYYRKTVSDRLRLFLELCHAVEYAHANRILHRDLKPSNVLVTASGSVKVLDFGVARMLEPRTDHELTRPGETPWTKAYASPEQLRGEPLSFASDVYALGVVLYELLTGELPFPTAALLGPDWLDVITGMEPAPPRFPGERGLQANLDAVVLTALAKDPRRRYRRVDLLRADIERCLHGEPVTARKCGVWERVRIWAARRPVTAVLVGCALLVWVAGTNVAVSARTWEVEMASRGATEAVRRVTYLAGSGLPAIERAIPRSADSMETRVTAAGIHGELLRRVLAMPAARVDALGVTVGQSALRCAEEWQQLGRPREALAATELVFPRIRALIGTDPRDPRWKDLYGELLRTRIELRRTLGEVEAMNRELEELRAFEARRRP